ncbi:hypothetical protein BGW42_001202 [Actinomortierella wolfii]|nr:hypothetical protein BGW42_001202 [Actinomortierella wolfii]
MSTTSTPVQSSSAETASFDNEDTVMVSIKDIQDDSPTLMFSAEAPEMVPSKLQDELKAISTTNRMFENWAKTFRCVPEQYFTPSTEDDVIKIIHLARILGKKVKAIGSGHSPSDLACTDGFMINTDKLNRLINVDQATKTVTVEAGMRLQDLHPILEQHGLALSSLGSISEQSIAGATATATHGSGAEFQSLCGSVLDLTMITASGNRIYCSKTVNSDLFHAAVCSMGSLGIITRMTLQCEDAFRLESIQEPGKLSDVLDRMDELIHSAQHVRIWWYPYTGNVVIWRANRTTKAIQQPPPSWRSSYWFSSQVYQAMLYVTRFIPNLIPALSRFMFWATQSRRIERVDTSFKVFNFDCLFPQYTTEWAIPWSRTSDALRALEQFVEHDQTLINGNEGDKGRRVRVHSPVEIRFVKKDDIWLSPAYMVDICYIGLIMYRPYGLPVPYKRMWTGFEKIMSSLGGRPHWAKAHPVTFEELRASYPKLDEFTQIRKELDPTGMFMNDYLKRHLEPTL